MLPPPSLHPSSKQAICEMVRLSVCPCLPGILPSLKHLLSLAGLLPSFQVALSQASSYPCSPVCLSVWGFPSVLSLLLRPYFSSGMTFCLSLLVGVCLPQDGTLYR